METSSYCHTTGIYLPQVPYYATYALVIFFFMSESNVANYTDDKTLYACEKNYMITQCAKKVRI